MMGFSLKTRNSKLKTLIGFIVMLGCAAAAQAAEVGRFTQVEGQVELLKAGQSPAVPAAAQTGVEEKDVIKTGDESRAQLRFLDDTILTIAPLSQVTIESYLYDAQQKKRQSSFEVAQGLVHAVVTKIFQEKEPDFFIKTQTAVMGVRGTEFYVLLTENADPENAPGVGQDKSMEVPQAQVSTDVYVKSGRVVMNSSNPAIKETVLLGPQQSTRVILNRPPGPRIALTPTDFQRLRGSLVTGVAAARIGRTRNPRELLQRLPIKPLRPGPPLKPGESRSRLEGKPPAPAARPPIARTPGPQGQPPQQARSPAAKPLKPGERPPATAGKQPPPREQKRPTRPEPLKKEPPRAAPAKAKPPGEPVRKAPVDPRKRKPTGEPAAKPATPKSPVAAPPKAAPPGGGVPVQPGQ
jgi:hypothetical protein